MVEIKAIIQTLVKLMERTIKRKNREATPKKIWRGKPAFASAKRTDETIKRKPRNISRELIEPIVLKAMSLAKSQGRKNLPISCSMPNIPATRPLAVKIEAMFSMSSLVLKLFTMT